MAAKELGVIDPSTDIVLLNGVQVVGWADDDVAEIAKDENHTDTFKGINNEYTISVIQDSLGTLTLRLQETSPTNNILFATLGAYKSGQFRTLPFTIKRKTTVIGSGKFWVETQPVPVLGRTTKVYEWVLKVDNANLNLTLASSLIP